MALANVSSAEQQAYLQTMLPHAKDVANQLGVDGNKYGPLIASWWSWETHFGTNLTAKANNHAGIGAMSSGDDGPMYGHAGYNTLDKFKADYVRTLGADDYRGYGPVVDAMRAGKDYKTVTQLHNDSKWSVDPYNLTTIDTRARKIAGLPTNGSDQKKTVCQCPGCGRSLRLELV